MAFTKILGPGIATDTNVQVGIITASKFYGDGSALSNVISGVGINSAGSVIGTGVTILNFIGAGNTFSYNPATQTVNVSIAGGGAIVAKQSFTVGAGGQSIFTLTNNYDTGMIDVYVNGIRLPTADFTETSSNVVTLSYAAEQGDAVEFIAYSQRVQNTVLESTVTNLRVTGVSSVGTGITMYGSSGIISATKYYGDGSGLTNVAGETPVGKSGFAANVMSIANVGTVSEDTTLTPVGTDTLMYTKYQDVVISDNIALIISDNSVFILDAFEF
jgi:hypothetical protein